MQHTTKSRSAARKNLDLLSDFDESVLSDAMMLLDELSGTSVRLLFHICGLESCHRGLCCAKVKTLGERMGCSDRTVRRRFAELADSGLVQKLRRRCRTAWRGLTDLGRAVIAVVKSGGALAVSAHLSGQLSGQLAAHKGVAESPRNNSPRAAVPVDRKSRGGAGAVRFTIGPDFQLVKGSADPRRMVDPMKYQRPKIATRLSDRTWSSLASWMGSANSVSWARCKIAHRSFRGLVMSIHRSREWGAFNRVMCSRGKPLSAECLVRLAIDDAVRNGRDFGTVETAMRYVSKILIACVSELRLPGENPPKRVSRA